ncbi:YtpI family protein [Salipaludibacillus daqingensis]|uniref:YtpI family protein n=1 Tax=Salipaludibacillus daqingensis TaxID=3041001 RepID=UPI0024766351|nr:YtpI family protein [Salipaludibacillus daqingensis]
MILIFLIFASLVTFVYYKVQQSRGISSTEKRFYSSKGSIAIGIFFISFGINSYINLQTSISAYITLLFVIFGLVNVYFGYKHVRLLSPHIKEENTQS